MDNPNNKGQNKQHRKFQITQNNPEQYGLTPQIMREKVLTMEGVQYACGCEEISDSGTPHIHIFFFAPGKKRFSVIKKLFPNAHIEAAYGSCRDNRDYVLKAGKWEETEKAETSVKNSFWEYGVLPNERSEEEPELAGIMELLENGASTGEIVKSYPKYALRTRKIDELQSTLLHNTYDHITRGITLTYIFGPSNIDKFAIVCNRYDLKTIYRIAYYPYNKRVPSFDSYNSQSVLVFDNFNGQIPLDTMTYFLSKYPVMLPARYMDKPACYSEVYIISDISPEILYFKPWYYSDLCTKNSDKNDVNLNNERKHELQRHEQFLRLINTIIEVDEKGIIIREEDYHYEQPHKIGASRSNDA